jgi:hypothetical protein
MRRTKWLALLLPFIFVATALAQGPTPGGPPSQQPIAVYAPAGTPASGQVTVASTATLVRAANAKRSTITIVNHGTTNVFVSFTNGVTTLNAPMLVGVPGSTLVFSVRTDVWAIAASGSQVIGWYEELLP